MKDKMGIFFEKELTEEEQRYIRNEIEDKYNPSTIFRTYGAGWEKIAEETIEVYLKAHKG